jgi:signal transduction histidine kinase
MMMRWYFLFIRAHPTRAVLEALILGIMGWTVLFFLKQFLPSFTWQIGISLCVGLGCVFWCALRLRLPGGEKRQRGLFEITTGAILCFLLAIIELIVTLILRQGTVSSELWQGPIRPFLLTAIAFILDYSMFILCRLGVRLWLFWNHLRRKQLVWELTSAHILVMLFLTGSLLVLLEILIVTHLSDAFLVVSTTLGLLILSAIMLIAIVPPSILFSYLVMRHTTQRVKTLAVATSELREGNYGIRIQVDGEDEVAQLQDDFNLMADKLEHSMQELQEERDRVATLLNERRELIASVSHELRTPVATLRSYLETTLMHLGERSTPVTQRELQEMEGEVINLQLLIDDLFSLARSEVGKLELRYELTDIGQLAQAIVEKGAPLAWQSSRIEMVAGTPSEIVPVLVDPKRLEQVLRNLLHNAVRHTPPGGIVAVEVKVKPEAVLIRVKDTGEGISPKDLPHIWERFFQTERSQTRIEGGAGLGLALVKDWIEEMGGTVSVESVVGEGSCFSLLLPRSIKFEREMSPNGANLGHSEAALEFGDRSYQV